MQITVIDHPLAAERLAILRDATTSNAEFRQALDGLGGMLVYEATRSLATTEGTVITPLGPAPSRSLAQVPLLVPVLRAGVGLVQPALRLIPQAEVGFVGLARDEETFNHMLFVLPVRQAYRDKLHAITHIDGTARVQTVTRETNQRFYDLLKAFEVKAGLPVVLNTSFNVRGQPIVCNPVEAVDTFLSAGLAALVIDNFIVTAKK